MVRGDGSELPDIERAVQAMNLLPQTLNFQGILFVHPSRLIDGRKQTMEADGLRIFPDRWKQQSAGFRFMSWLSYGLLRLVMGISGYAREEKNMNEGQELNALNNLRTIP
jgi:hypothetical protein